MRLTPIEIRQQRFRSRLRGYDPAEVETFVEAVVTDFEDVVRENAMLRREIERSSRELDAYRGRERNIQETLTTAQGVVEQLKHTAIKEAEVMIGEAEVRAEKLLCEAQARHADLTHGVTELSHLRERLEIDLRNTLQGYLSLIDAYQDARTADRTGSPGRGRRDP